MPATSAYSSTISNSTTLLFIFTVFMKVVYILVFIKVLVLESTNQLLAHTSVFCLCAAVVVFFSIIALRASSILQIFLYSSFQHTVFILLPMLASITLSSIAISAFYLLSYLFGVIPVFVVALFKNKIKFTGLSQIVLVFSLMSLFGLPPFIGFFAKLLIVFKLAESGFTFSLPIVLFCSLISAVYYFRALNFSSDR